MGGTTKFPRTEALKVARELCSIISPLCEPDRLKVCGSLRRNKQSVGDVEIVFIQKEELLPDPSDLLGNLIPTPLVWRKVDELVQTGALERRPKVDGTETWGEKIRLALHCESQIPVDFFAARRENWWNIVVSRTGSLENNIRICKAALKRGWMWQPNGFGFCDRYSGEIVRRASSEREVFEAVGLEYSEPWER